MISPFALYAPPGELRIGKNGTGAFAPKMIFSIVASLLMPHFPENQQELKIRRDITQLKYPKNAFLVLLQTFL